MVSSNKPAYVDSTGPNTKYGFDLQLDKTLFKLTSKAKFRLMLGLDAFGADTGFTRGAGRAGLYADIPNTFLQIGYFHRSEHSLEHVNIDSYRRFYSSDWVSVKLILK